MGKYFLSQLSKDLKANFPNLKGFAYPNIRVKSKMETDCNCPNDNEFYDCGDCKGYNMGNIGGNNRIDMEYMVASKDTECNDSCTALKYNSSSIVEAIIVINKLPFTSDEKAQL